MLLLNCVALTFHFLMLVFRSSVFALYCNEPPISAQLLAFLRVFCMMEGKTRSTTGFTLCVTHLITRHLQTFYKIQVDYIEYKSMFIWDRKKNASLLSKACKYAWERFVLCSLSRLQLLLMVFLGLIQLFSVVFWQRSSGVVLTRSHLRKCNTLYIRVYQSSLSYL